MPWRTDDEVYQCLPCVCYLSEEAHILQGLCTAHPHTQASANCSMPPPPRLTPDQVRYGHAGRAFKAQDSWRFDVCVAQQGAKLPDFFHRSFFPLFLDLLVALALSTTVLEVTDSEGGKTIKRRGKKIKKMKYGHGTNSSSAPVAQWIRRLPTEQEIVGSIPAGGTSMYLILHF